MSWCCMDRPRWTITPLTDVEHQFCKPEHIAAALDIPLGEAGQIVEGIIAANNASLAADFTNKRSDLKSKILKTKANVPSAADLRGAQISFEFVKGKRLFGLLNGELTKLQYNPMHLTNKKTDALKIPELSQFAETESRSRLSEQIFRVDK
jgi:hypothetical protein